MIGKQFRGYTDWRKGRFDLMEKKVWRECEDEIPIQRNA
jgi:hypothetical protein